MTGPYPSSRWFYCRGLLPSEPWLHARVSQQHCNDHHTYPSPLSLACLLAICDTQTPSNNTKHTDRNKTEPSSSKSQGPKGTFGGSHKGPSAGCQGSPQGERKIIQSHDTMRHKKSDIEREAALFPESSSSHFSLWIP